MFVKGGYFVEISDKDGNRVILEVVDDHVFEEVFEHEEICIQSFDFIFSINIGRDVFGTMLNSFLIC